MKRRVILSFSKKNDNCSSQLMVVCNEVGLVWYSPYSLVSVLNWASHLSSLNIGRHNKSVIFIIPTVLRQCLASLQNTATTDRHPGSPGALSKLISTDRLISTYSKSNGVDNTFRVAAFKYNFSASFPLL